MLLMIFQDFLSFFLVQILKQLIDQSLNQSTQQQAIPQLSLYKQQQGNKYLYEITELFCQEQQPVYALELSHQIINFNIYDEDVIAQCCKVLLNQFLQFPQDCKYIISENLGLASGYIFFNNKFPMLFDMINQIQQQASQQVDIDCVYQIIASIYQFKYGAILNDDLCLLLLEMLEKTQESIFNIMKTGNYTKKLTMALVTIVSSALSWEDYPSYFDDNTEQIIQLIVSGCNQQQLTVEQQEKILQIIFNLIIYHQQDMQNYNCLNKLYEQLFIVVNQYEIRPPYIISLILSKLQAFTYSQETSEYLINNFQNQCIQSALNCLNYVSEIDDLFVYNLCSNNNEGDIISQAINLLNILKQQNQDIVQQLTQFLDQQQDLSQPMNLNLCQVIGDQQYINKCVQDIIIDLSKYQSWENNSQDIQYKFLKQWQFLMKMMYKYISQQNQIGNQILEFIVQNQNKICQNNYILTIILSKSQQLANFDYVLQKLQIFIKQGLFYLQQSNYTNIQLAEGICAIIQNTNCSQDIIQLLINTFIFILQNQIGQQISNIFSITFCQLSIKQDINVQKQSLQQLIQTNQQLLNSNKYDQIALVIQCIILLLNGQFGIQLCQEQCLQEFINVLLQKTYYNTQSIDKIAAIYLIQTFLRLTKLQQIGYYFEEVVLYLINNQQNMYIITDLMININILAYQQIYMIKDQMSLVKFFYQRKNYLLFNKQLLKQVTKWILIILQQNYVQITQQLPFQEILDKFLLPGSQTFTYSENKQPYIVLLAQIYQQNQQDVQLLKQKIMKCFGYLFNKLRINTIYDNKNQLNSNLTIQLMKGVVYDVKQEPIQNLEQQICQLLQIQDLRQIK